MSDFIVTTTSSLEGYEIKSYLGTVSANVVTGTGFFSDFAASFSDVFGGRSQTYQKQLKSLYDEVEKKVRASAKNLGANAVLGFRVDFDELSGKAKQMLMVSALGTAVYAKKIKTDSEDIYDNSNMKNVLSADELNDKFKIEDTLSRLEKSIFSLEDEDWELLIKYQESRSFPIILKKISKRMDDSALREKVKNFFLSLPAEDLKNIIYSSLENDFSLLPFAEEIINEAKLFDYHYINKFLDDNNFEVKKRALHLVKCEKDFYSAEDIILFETLANKIKDSFTDLSTIETKKGLTGSKEKWRCSFCEGYNDLDVIYCKNVDCEKNRYGFDNNDLKPSQVIDILSSKAKILKEHFAKE